MEGGVHPALQANRCSKLQHPTAKHLIWRSQPSGAHNNNHNLQAFALVNRQCPVQSLVKERFSEVLQMHIERFWPVKIGAWGHFFSQDFCSQAQHHLPRAFRPGNRPKPPGPFRLADVIKCPSTSKPPLTWHLPACQPKNCGCVRAMHFVQPFAASPLPSHA